MVSARATIPIAMAMIRVVTSRSSCFNVLRGPRSGEKQAGGHSGRRPRSVHSECKIPGSRGFGRVALPGGNFRRGGPADPWVATHSAPRRLPCPQDVVLFPARPRGSGVTIPERT
jgi:hypothetical protein